MSEAALLDDPPVTIATFDAFLAAQADGRPWELVAGRIVGMTNPSAVHEQIVSNIGMRLKRAADERGCQAFFGGMRIQRSESRTATDKPRPDLLVRCAVMLRQNFVTDPLIVVEVLSPSTMDIDRGEKLRFYKRLPTLLHIALVYQDQIRIEHSRRGDQGWELETLTDPAQALVFEAIGCVVGWGRHISGRFRVRRHNQPIDHLDTFFKMSHSHIVRDDRQEKPLVRLQFR